MSFGASALARLGDRCWEAVEALKGDWLRPFAALLLTAPPQQHFEVRGAPCKQAQFAHADGTEVSTRHLVNKLMNIAAQATLLSVVFRQSQPYNHRDGRP